jgi:hypothetical protein
VNGEFASVHGVVSWILGLLVAAGSFVVFQFKTFVTNKDLARVEQKIDEHMKICIEERKADATQRQKDRDVLSGMEAFLDWFKKTQG